MSENQYLEIIENKLDAVTQLIEQQSKSGVFFDGFTKQVLEKIHNKLEYISNFETNELITYLTEELKRSLEDRHNVLQQRFDSVQGQINNIQTNLADSLKSPEVAAIFTKLSDTVLDFSRDLNSQTKYFNSTVEDIQNKIAKIDIQETLGNYSEQIKTNVENYHNNVKNLATDINYSFTAIKNVIEKNTSANEIVALAGDISVLQKGLNDVISSVLAINAKQGDIITAVADISSSMDVQDIRLDVSSLIAEIQALKDALRVLVNKSDIEALNERVQSAIESLSNFRELSVYNNDENKNILKTYFNDLNNLLSTLVSKEES